MLNTGADLLHSAHGAVEVVGIWRGVERVDTAENETATDNSTMIVCYTIHDNGPVGELSSTLDEFVASIEPSE